MSHSLRFNAAGAERSGQMRVSHIVNQVLSDADLQAVLEVYRLEGDKDDLLDSVKRIARKTIDETVAAGLPGGGDE